MIQGFAQSADETKIKIIIRRLTPAIKRQDDVAVGRGIQELEARYGEDLFLQAWQQLMQQHPWLWEKTFENLSESQKQEFHGSAFDVLADVIADAGLRPIERHLRVSDEGFLLSKDAVKVVRATGYPNSDDLGEGLDSLDDVGLSRDPFWHPLSQTKEFDKGETGLNYWATASLVISASHGWIEDEEPSQGGKNNLRAMVAAASPTCDFEALWQRSKYDDRALLRLASLAHEALEARGFQYWLSRAEVE